MFQLRKIKSEGADDSQYLHSLTYVDLSNEQFKNILRDDVTRLNKLKAGLEFVVNQHSVPDSKMRSVLNSEQYADYVKSFDWDMSHVESDERDDMPWQLRDYVEKVRQGDKFTRIANLFKRSKKRDANGRTAFTRYQTKAEGCYEDAVMDLTNYVDTNPLRNPKPNSELAGQVLRWLDRDVNPEHGYGPDTTAAGVPRVRGIKSIYTLVDDEPVVGVRLRKHWRQREALVKATLELLYDEVEEKLLTEEQLAEMRKKYQQMLRIINGDDD